MNKIIADNYSKIKFTYLIFPALLMCCLVLLLIINHAISAPAYINIQKDSFFYLNAHLSQFPRIQYNVTQLGDALIALSMVSVFLVYAPIIWETLISASLISLIFSTSLKNWFAVPRPAAVFDHQSFVIIGRALPGHSSLPSGHSITIFTTLTVLLFAFNVPKGIRSTMLFISVVIIGLLLSLSRVAVGAHYPLDVAAGSIIGYTSALMGIFIAQKYKIWSWLYDIKLYPLLMALLVLSSIILINRIANENLPIYYLSLGSIIFSLYTIVNVYRKTKF